MHFDLAFPLKKCRISLNVYVDVFPLLHFSYYKTNHREKKGVDLSDQDIVIVQYRNEGEKARARIFLFLEVIVYVDRLSSCWERNEIKQAYKHNWHGISVLYLQVRVHLI